MKDEVTGAGMPGGKGSAAGKSVLHPFEPVFDENSRVLVLGSFPSEASRAAGFFYGHPRNRFWRVMAAVFGEDVPVTIEEKRAFLLRSRVALWDVAASCEVTGSSDATIRRAVPTDLARIFSCAPVARVFLNGQKAAALYKAFFAAQKISAECLPSTSPANAAWSFERLTAAWARVAAAALTHPRQSFTLFP